MPRQYDVEHFTEQPFAKHSGRGGMRKAFEKVTDATRCFDKL